MDRQAKTVIQRNAAKALAAHLRWWLREQPAAKE